MKTHAHRSWPLRRPFQFTTCWLSSLCVALLLTLPARAQNAPVIVEEPEDAVISLGGDASFKVRATATAPAWVEWYRADGDGNTLLLGTNNNARSGVTLTVTRVQAADAGGYYAVITNDWGTATSRIAQLTVDPTFTKITTGSVVTDRATGAWESPTWWDYDNDGLLDLFVPQQWGRDLVSCALYHQHPVGTFTRVTNAITTPRRGVWLAAVGDYDNDGYDDLLMAHFFGADDLFRNEGGGIFTAQTQSQAGPPVGDNDDSASVGWADYDRDGWIDLFAANSSYPSAMPARNDCLYRNNGNGTFTKMTVDQVGMVVGDQAPTGPFSWVDYNNDGWPDLWIGSANAENPPTGSQYLWRNNGDGTFSRVSAGSLDLNLATGIGIWGDYDNDGYLDLFLTAWTGTNSLHRNLGGQTFSDVSAAAGVAEEMGSWPAAWGDYDNDGFLDLIVPRYGTRGALYRNNGDGTFASVDVGSPLRDGDSQVGVAWADYDNDGFLDLLITREHQGAQNLLYRNNGNGNGWLKVKLMGTASNRSAIGAKLRVQATIRGQAIWQMREITGNSGSDGGSGGLLAHFGLGDAAEIEVLRIEWPSGIVQELTDLEPNQLLRVIETQNAAPTQVPQIADFSTGDGLRVLVDCPTEPMANVRCVLEASDDLVRWAKVQVRVNETGTMEFSDPDAAEHPRRFYRVVVP